MELIDKLLKREDVFEDLGADHEVKMVIRKRNVLSVEGYNALDSAKGLARLHIDSEVASVSLFEEEFVGAVPAPDVEHVAMDIS